MEHRRIHLTHLQLMEAFRATVSPGGPRKSRAEPTGGPRAQGLSLHCRTTGVHHSLSHASTVRSTQPCLQTGQQRPGQVRTQSWPHSRARVSSAFTPGRLSARPAWVLLRRQVLLGLLLLRRRAHRTPTRSCFRQGTTPGTERASRETRTDNRVATTYGFHALTPQTDAF